MNRLFIRILVIALFALVGTTIYSRFFGYQTALLTDLQSPMSVSLRSKEEYPTHIELVISGVLPGEALLEWDCPDSDGKNCRFQERIGPGKVRIKKERDWYSPFYVLNYTPLTVASSSKPLRIEYRF